jgi:hypothetical protein
MTADVFGNGTKQTWRGTMLNECFRRLPRTPSMRKNLRAMYLVGPVDRDGPALLARGLDIRNLIAVDVDDHCIESARKSSSIAIKSKVQYLFEAMGDGDVPDLILLDLMGGITRSTLRIVIAMLRCAGMKKNTVVMFNLLAGRDPFVKEVHTGRGSMHRGEYISRSIARWAIWGEDFDTYIASPRDVVDQMDVWCGQYHSRRPGKSTRLRYDSVVFNWPFDGAAPIGEFTIDDYEARQIAKARRKLSAAKAVRTIRLAGR